MNKGCVIAAVVVGLVLVLCAGGGGLLFYWVFSVTGEAATAADQFLGQIAEGKVNDAYESAAAGLKSQQSAEAFADSVKELGLNDYASSSWSSRKIVNDEATLEGSIKTKSGGTIPLKMTLVKESSGWRVLSVEGPKGGVSQSPKKKLPSDDELRRLATATLLDFDGAIKAKDFGDFHGKVSTPLRQQKTAAELRQAFQKFVDEQIDLSPVKGIAPVFDEPPALDEEGALVLSGYYPTQPSRVTFKLRYLYEHPAWKLLSINVKVTASE